MTLTALFLHFHLLIESAADLLQEQEGDQALKLLLLLLLQWKAAYSVKFSRG